MLDPFDIFERQAAEDIMRRREDARARNEADAAADAKETAARIERSRQLSLKANARQLIAQYEAAGIEPLAVAESGAPLVSLSMLLWIGWRIENVSGENRLVRPAAPKAREDYDDRNT